MAPYIPYIVSNNTTGMINFLTATRDGLASQSDLLGASILGMAILIVLWFITFLPLSRINMGAAFVVASFICWVITILLMTIRMIHEMVFVLFSLMLLMGVVAYYLQTRN